MNPFSHKDKRVVFTNVIVIILLSIVLVTLVNLTGKINKEGFQCINDPLGYGAGKLKQINNAEFSCTCGLAKPNSPILFFNSESKSLTYPDVGAASSILTDFNLSELFTSEDI